MPQKLNGRATEKVGVCVCVCGQAWACECECERCESMRNCSSHSKYLCTAIISLCSLLLQSCMHLVCVLLTRSFVRSIFFLRYCSQRCCSCRCMNACIVWMLFTWLAVVGVGTLQISASKASFVSISHKTSLLGVVFFLLLLLCSHSLTSTRRYTHSHTFSFHSQLLYMQ